jgi:copper chaperone NosL
MMKRGILSLGLMALLAVACTPGAGEPAEPIWGKQACGHCSMLVTEKPPSAQLTLNDGTRRFFDDVGCLVAWLDREGQHARAMWVRKGDGWVPAAEARYASGVVTPMDFGFIAADQGIGWDEVKAAVREKTHAHGARQ